jgi:hypothetical protein
MLVIRTRIWHRGKRVARGLGGACGCFSQLVGFGDDAVKILQSGIEQRAALRSRP